MTHHLTGPGVADSVVAANLSRQQRHPPLYARPHHLHLERAVEQDGIERPCSTEDSGDAQLGRGRVQLGGRPAVVQAVDRGDPLK